MGIHTLVYAIRVFFPFRVALIHHLPFSFDLNFHTVLEVTFENIKYIDFLLQFCISGYWIPTSPKLHGWLVEAPRLEPGPSVAQGRCCFLFIMATTFLNRLFKSSFKFTTKSSWTYKNFPYTLCLHSWITSPTIYIPHQNDYNWWTYYYQLIIINTVHSLGFITGIIHSMGLEKFIMTYIHHCSNIQSSLLP